MWNWLKFISGSYFILDPHIDISIIPLKSSRMINQHIVDLPKIGSSPIQWSGCIFVFNPSIIRQSRRITRRNDLSKERLTISFSFQKDDDKHTRARLARYTRVGLRRDAACRLKNRRRFLLSFSGGVRGRVCGRACQHRVAAAAASSATFNLSPSMRRDAACQRTLPRIPRPRGAQTSIGRNVRSPVNDNDNGDDDRDEDAEHCRSGKTSRVASPIVVAVLEKAWCSPYNRSVFSPLDVCTARRDASHPHSSERDEHNARDNTARRWWTKGGWLRRGGPAEENGDGERRRERTIARKFRSRVHGPVKVARLLSYIIVARDKRGRERDMQSAEMRLYTGCFRAFVHPFFFEKGWC